MSFSSANAFERRTAILLSAAGLSFLGHLGLAGASTERLANHVANPSISSADRRHIAQINRIIQHRASQNSSAPAAVIHTASGTTYEARLKTPDGSMVDEYKSVVPAGESAARTITLERHRPGSKQPARSNRIEIAADGSFKIYGRDYIHPDEYVLDSGGQLVEHHGTRKLVVEFGPGYARESLEDFLLNVDYELGGLGA